MIQGDNLVGNPNSSSNNRNMDIFESIDIGGSSDVSLLYALKSTEFLQAENFNLEEFVNESALFKEEEEEEIKEVKLIEQAKNDVFPDLTQYDHGNLEFNIILNQPANRNNNTWFYSQELEKIFISLNKPFHFDIEHKYVDYDLYLRVMMVFIEEISSPVKRCQNHIHSENDDSKSDSKKFSIIRTENPRGEYCGNENGKNIKDRLSVLIPLSNVVPNEKNMAKQSIALKFLCQNSCIGRKQTAVIFYLENNRGYILSKKVVKIKVCSCPKRDKAAEEQKNLKAKRTAGQAQFLPHPHPGKIPKIEEELHLLSPPMSYNSPSVSDDNNSNHNNINTIKMEIPSQSVDSGLTTLSDGSVNLNIQVPDNRIARDIIKFAYNCIAGEITRNPMNSNWMVYLDDLKKIQDE